MDDDTNVPREDPDIEESIHKLDGELDQLIAFNDHALTQWQPPPLGTFNSKPSVLGKGASKIPWVPRRESCYYNPKWKGGKGKSKGNAASILPAIQSVLSCMMELPLSRHDLKLFIALNMVVDSAYNT